MYGGQERTIEIRLHKEVCEALNLTASKIGELLNRQTQKKMFAGNVTEADSRYFVHVHSAYTQVSELEYLVVAESPMFLKAST